MSRRTAARPTAPPELRQKLFQSSAERDKSKEMTQTTLNKVQVDHDVDVALHSLQRDLHEQQLKKLRELTKTISEDDWMYPPADKLLGLK